ncbi:response regulator [Novosphingobium indicum]|uniref:Response regulator n=1 Tax=Novosphingobium indicum TaxID=462949 RepID=A0ABQ2JVI3_9SPHN|nr:response regulator [Novosphingobium indicum]GGN54092.1 response regulator [Novosphingobium indicum]
MPELPTVAIVDDDEAVREALGDLLMVSGLTCQTFEGAASFLDATTKRHFDCLITDIRMPDMSGIELIEHLQKRCTDLPVIVISSVLDQHVRSSALSLGVHAWFTKPVSDERLLGAIAAAIANGSGADTGQ